MAHPRSIHFAEDPDGGFSSLQASLTIAITGPLGQELQVDQRYEGTAAITGTYKGEKVTGLTYIEMLGYWR